MSTTIRHNTRWSAFSNGAWCIGTRRKCIPSCPPRRILRNYRSNPTQPESTCSSKSANPPVKNNLLNDEALSAYADYERQIYIVFDVSELFMLSDFSIESALYGDLVVRLTAPSTPGGPIGEPTLFRNGRGFFGKSSRVSAVVFHTRQLDQGKLENRWRVFPTNPANDDTIQLEEAELSLFGDLEDRKNLSAEICPRRYRLLQRMH